MLKPLNSYNKYLYSRSKDNFKSIIYLHYEGSIAIAVQAYIFSNRNDITRITRK